MIPFVNMWLLCSYFKIFFRFFSFPFSSTIKCFPFHFVTDYLNYFRLFISPGSYVDVVSLFFFFFFFFLSFYLSSRSSKYFSIHFVNDYPNYFRLLISPGSYVDEIILRFFFFFFLSL